MKKFQFQTALSEGRPVRLSEETRRFAWESLHATYGDEAMEHRAISMADVTDPAVLSARGGHELYDRAIERIAAEAPVRICPHERICGAATLGDAIGALVPVTFCHEERLEGIHHMTANFFVAVREGMDAVEARLDARMERAKGEPLSPRQRDFLDSMKRTLASFRMWHKRYVEATAQTRPDLHALLLQVPFGPARSFHEAVQSLWFCFAFTRLTGNWPGIGRIDELLGPYLDADLASGKLTLDEAREILASFFIKGCEWIRSETPVVSGDAQHYQNLILGGVNADGEDVTNAVTYLVLDVVEELPIADYPITVRLSEQSPGQLFRRVAEVQRHGGGAVAIYNEPLILDALQAYGYDLREARTFANDGCWEVQIPGKTRFSYSPFDALQVLQKHTLKLDASTPAHFENFESLYAAYRADLATVVKSLIDGVYGFWAPGWGTDGEIWRPHSPCTVISLFVDGCMESARSYSEGGTPYTVSSPHIGGAPDAGNSLAAIDRLVWKEKKISFDELMRILQKDWEGAEPFRQYVRHRMTWYGNDDDEADGYTVRILNDFADICREERRDGPIFCPPGVSTFGRQIEWSPHRLAVPFGYRKGDILSGNASPTPGTDTEGATATVRSYCKADLTRQTTGAALDIRLFPGTVEGENGVKALEGLLRGFLRLGGFFMQVDVVDAETLRRAQEHPQDYKTLSVRVSGWNARFVTLSREWQEMIIERTAHEM